VPHRAIGAGCLSRLLRGISDPTPIPVLFLAASIRSAGTHRCDCARKASRQGAEASTMRRLEGARLHNLRKKCLVGKAARLSCKQYCRAKHRAKFVDYGLPGEFASCYGVNLAVQYFWGGGWPSDPIPSEAGLGPGRLMAKLKSLRKKSGQREKSSLRGRGTASQLAEKVPCREGSTAFLQTVLSGEAQRQIR